MNLKTINNLKIFIPVILYQNFNNEFCLVISKENLVFSLNLLKYHIGLQYSLLSCISGVDLLQDKYRFSVVYDLLSLTFYSRLRIKIFIDDYMYVPSIINIFKNANWWEREIWDLYGIFFEFHSDLRRLLNDYSFEGYPMRKDFPLSGFTEVKYSQNHASVTRGPVQLSQEARNFHFMSAGLYSVVI